MSEAKPDIRQMGAKLRLQVCALLKLEPENLSAGDEVLVARVGALKLLVSDLESAQLRGERIDVAEYVRASEALESAVRTDHRVSDTGSIGLEEARNKLRQLLGDIGHDPDDPDRPRSEIEILRAENMQLREEVAGLKSRPATSAAEPKLEPAPSPRPGNVVPIREAGERWLPPGYLKCNQVEPWEEYYRGGGGVICAPYFPIDQMGRPLKGS
jgi:hypothetical protein